MLLSYGVFFMIHSYVILTPIINMIATQYLAHGHPHFTLTLNQLSHTNSIMVPSWMIPYGSQTLPQVYKAFSTQPISSIICATST